MGHVVGQNPNSKKIDLVLLLRELLRNIRFTTTSYNKIKYMMIVFPYVSSSCPI